MAARKTGSGVDPDHEAPLECTERTEIDPDTGGRIKITRTKRGMLVTESKSYEPMAFQSWLKEQAIQPTPRVALENYVEDLRQQLSKEGYPTDRQPHWFRIDDGEWQPQNPDEPLPAAGLISQSHWDTLVRKLAPPLSRIAAVGDLLSALVDLLNMKGLDDKHLRQIGLLMDRFAHFRLTGPVNLLVDQAVKARKGRSQGPKTIKKRTAEVTKIVLQHAADFRIAHPTYVKDASNTGAAIADAVNAELGQKQLLPKSKNKLSVKTIIGYVSKGN